MSWSALSQKVGSPAQRLRRPEKPRVFLAKAASPVGCPRRLRQALSQRHTAKSGHRNEGRNKGGSEVISLRWIQPSGCAPSPLKGQKAAGRAGLGENKPAGREPGRGGPRQAAILRAEKGMND